MGAAIRVSFLAVLGAFLVVQPAPVSAQLSEGEQACVNAMNKDGVKVALTQGKENLFCVTGRGKEALPGPAQECLGADSRDKVAAQAARTVSDQDELCAVAPGFAYSGASSVNAAARQGELDLVADVFGHDLDAALVTCASNPARCKCQQAVEKSVEKLVKSAATAFNRCKKLEIQTAASAAEVAGCVSDPWTKGSIASQAVLGRSVEKAAIALGTTVTKYCDDPGVTAGSFPGACASLSGTALRDCLEARAECRVCEMINDMDALAVDCDTFDDGARNCTCDLVTQADDFDRPDGTTVGGWTEQLEDWSIDGERLRTGADAWSWATFDGSSGTDGTLTARAMYGSGASIRSAGLTMRWVSPSSNVMVKIQDNDGSGFWNSIFLYENGGYVDYGIGLSLGTDAVISLEMRGTAVTAKVDTDRDGTWDLILGPHLVTNTNAGLVGVSAYGPAYLDDFRAGICP